MKTRISSGLIALAIVALLAMLPTANAASDDVNFTVADFEPTGMSYDVGESWINFTWNTTNEISTDGYNATITDCSNTSLISTWYNVSSGAGTVNYSTDQDNAYLNITGLEPFETAQIEVWAYNESAGMSINSSTSEVAKTEATSLNYVNVPEQFTPDVNNTIEVNISDSMSEDDQGSITIHLFRNDTTIDTSNNNFNRYTITYDMDAGSLSINPSAVYYVPEAYVVQAPDYVNVTKPTFKFDWKPPTQVAPSYGTQNSTINDYVWEIRVQFKASGDVTETMWNNTTSEMTTQKAMTVTGHTLSIEGQAAPGNSYQLYPTMMVTNGGNVPLDLNKSMTDLTGDTGYTIPAENLYLDDDPNHDESTETDLLEVSYTNSMQLWGIYLYSVSGGTLSDTLDSYYYERPGVSDTFSCSLTYTFDKSVAISGFWLDNTKEGSNLQGGSWMDIDAVYCSQDGETFNELTEYNYGGSTSAEGEVIPLKLEEPHLCKAVKMDATLHCNELWEANLIMKVYYSEKAITAYNFIEIPSDTPAGFYTGTWSFSAEENWT